MESKLDLQKIKYYYTCLLFSFSYFSKYTSEKYSNEKDNLIVYRSSLFPENEIEIYNQYIMKLRIFNDFLLTCPILNRFVP